MSPVPFALLVCSVHLTFQHLLDRSPGEPPHLLLPWSTQRTRDAPLSRPRWAACVCVYRGRVVGQSRMSLAGTVTGDLGVQVVGRGLGRRPPPRGELPSKCTAPAEPRPSREPVASGRAR